MMSEKGRAFRGLEIPQKLVSMNSAYEFDVLRKLERLQSVKVTAVPSSKKQGYSLIPNYIHTSRGNDRKFIACRCPGTPESVGEMWSMIHEHNVSLVICLTETSPIQYGYYLT
jgi:hypothetical protein